MNMEHYIVMFVIMILSGMLSTMNVWSDKLSDINFSLNDLYMSLLMTGWMFLFMGVYYKHLYVIIFGLLLILISFVCIRKQLFINQTQYLSGMIPHHSMAVQMSKRLLEKNTTIPTFLNTIIKTQNVEIDYMKQQLKL